MARLYREHNEALIRFVMSRVDSEQEARDVAQEAYVRMLQLHSPGTVSLLSSYLFKTAANIAIDRMRQRSVRRRALQALGAGDSSRAVASPEQLVESREDILRIQQLVEELPPKCRQAFYLHRLHDVAPAEIAARLGVSKRMVHLYLIQALGHIQARLNSPDPPSHRQELDRS
jgi:RNA polymerase sigma-70 factor (ECF subfamily)